MFTGIIQSVGRVAEFDGRRLSLEVSAVEDGWDIGESVAVSGCCLTLVEASEFLDFELSEETLRRTTLGSLRQGDLVNVERAMRGSDRFGGHFVQGHVDTTGRVVDIKPQAQSSVFSFSVPQEYGHLLLDKGSIAIDGISLTVVGPEGSRFEVAIIPHTFEHTTLGRLRPGNPVNVEFDMLAKYVERILTARQTS